MYHRVREGALAVDRASDAAERAIRWFLDSTKAFSAVYRNKYEPDSADFEFRARLILERVRGANPGSVNGRLSAPAVDATGSVEATVGADHGGTADDGGSCTVYTRAVLACGRQPPVRQSRPPWTRSYGRLRSE